VRADFRVNYIASLRDIGISDEAVEAEVSVIMSVRKIWQLIPQDILVSRAPNYEKIARRVLAQDRLGYSSDVARMLSIIYRRVRAAYIDGRAGLSTLNLENPRFLTLIQSQEWACACCYHKFPEFPPSLIDEDDFEIFRQEHLAHENEVVLHAYYRKPVLDHIIPYFLGGDGPDNWQVLCQSCNLGKGESMAWVSRRGWLPPGRISESLSLTPSLRYSVLATSDVTVSGKICAGKELRLFKKKADRLVTFDNLECRFE
jgi:5-methylcytosine-specific restriction endonuclease McrA